MDTPAESTPPVRPLRRVCCVCRYLIGPDQQPTVPSVTPTNDDTHGYCEPCLDDFTDKLESADD